MPCKGEDCTLCDLFGGTKNLINFLLLCATVPLATIALVAGGLMMLFAGDNPETLKRGKTVLKYTIIGILVAFGAWLIVNTILAALGGTFAEIWNNPRCEGLQDIIGNYSPQK